jgi:hypothetical protein
VTGTLCEGIDITSRESVGLGTAAVAEIPLRKGLAGYLAGLVLLWLSGAAYAADPASLYGKWIEKFPNGNGMVTEFAASSISYYPVDAAGKATEAPRQNVVTYLDLDAGTIRINFQGGGGLVVLVKDAQTIVLDSAGAGAHRLVRMQP